MQKQLLAAALASACIAGPAGLAHANPPAGIVKDPTPLVVTPASPAHPFGASARITWNRAGTFPRQVFGLSLPTRGHDSASRAMNFVREYRGALGLMGDTRLLDLKSPTLHGARDGMRRTIVRLEQTIGELPVEGQHVVVTLDENERVVSVTSNLDPLEVAAVERGISAGDAARITERRFEVKALPQNAVQVVLPVLGRGRIAWKVPTAAIPLVAHFFVWVDAADGSIVHTAPAGPHQGLAAIPVRGNQ